MVARAWTAPAPAPLQSARCAAPTASGTRTTASRHAAAALRQATPSSARVRLQGATRPQRRRAARARAPACALPFTSQRVSALCGPPPFWQPKQGRDAALACCRPALSPRRVDHPRDAPHNATPLLLPPRQAAAVHGRPPRPPRRRVGGRQRDRPPRRAGPLPVRGPPLCGPHPPRARAGPAARAGRAAARARRRRRRRVARARGALHERGRRVRRQVRHMEACRRSRAAARCAAFGRAGAPLQERRPRDGRCAAPQLATMPQPHPTPLPLALHLTLQPPPACASLGT